MIECMSLCRYSVVDIPVLCSGSLAASSNAVVDSVPPSIWSVQYCSCSCSFERRPSRSKAPLVDLRLSSDDCVHNSIAAALDSVLVTGATKEPRARPWPWPCGMSTCLAGQGLYTLIRSNRKLPGKRDNHGHTLGADEPCASAGRRQR